MDQKDIYRTAQIMIDQHGDDAEIQAAMKADEMLDTGDLDGQVVWKAVIRAIADLRGGGDGTRH